MDVLCWRYADIPEVLGHGKGILVQTEDQLATALAEAEADRVLSELQPGAVAAAFGWAWKPVVRRWAADRAMAALRGAR